MKTEKLFELLTLFDNVQSRNWNDVRKLVDEISKGRVTIKEKKWADQFKQDHPEYYPLDLADIKTWSTFDGTCIDLRFSNDIAEENGQENNQLVCRATIYEGNSFGGYREGKRFEAVLWLSTAFIHEIEPIIARYLESHLEDAYDDYLESQKKLWIHNKRLEILK